MDALGQVRELVTRTRRRLAVGVLARGAVGGALAATLLALVVAVVLRWISPGLGVGPLLIVPVVGGAAGAAFVWGRRPTDAAAALSLDAAAGTDEAFVSALVGADAAPGFRVLTARYATARCDAGRVRMLFPVEPPRGLAPAVVCVALLAGIALVGAPDASAGSRAAGESGAAPREGITRTTAPAADARPMTPAERVALLAEALRDPAAEPGADALADARQDLGAISDEELRALALAAAEQGLSGAEDALEALDQGDRAAARDALRRALGGADRAPATDRGSDATPAAWGAPHWPLRYDSTVRRWIEAMEREERQER